MMKIKKKLTAAALVVLMTGAGLPALGNFRTLPDMAVTASAASVKVGDSWSIGDTANFGTYWYGSYSYSERSTAVNIKIPEPVKGTNPLTGAEVWEFPNAFSYDKIAAYGTIQSTPGMPTLYKSLTGSGSLKPTGIRIAEGAGTPANPLALCLLCTRDK